MRSSSTHRPAAFRTGDVGDDQRWMYGHAVFCMNTQCADFLNLPKPL
jgi:hypothetical protein